MDKSSESRCANMIFLLKILQKYSGIRCFAAWKHLILDGAHPLQLIPPTLTAQPIAHGVRALFKELG